MERDPSRASWLSSSSSCPAPANSTLPVFVFPSALAFFADDATSSKQILTLYNPYDFNVKFKVLSTSPKKYSVVEPQGQIHPRCCVDIVVRLVDVSLRNNNSPDQFRVMFFQGHDSGASAGGVGGLPISGKRDVPATLYPSRPSASSPSDAQFESITSGSNPSNLRQYQIVGESESGSEVRSGAGGRSSDNAGDRGPSPTNPVILLTAIACLIALILPNDGQEPSSWLPSYLHLTLPQKLLGAYVLGLVTMVIFKA